MPDKKTPPVVSKQEEEEIIADIPRRKSQPVASKARPAAVRIAQPTQPAPKEKGLTAKQRRKRRKRIRRIVFRSLLCLMSLLGVVIIGLYVVMDAVFHGPSATASDLLVNTMLETSALKFVPHLYFSAKEVNEIVARNAIEVPDEPTDTSMVVINRQNTGMDHEGGAEEDDIVLEEVSGGTYHGYMLIVKDPSRVTLGVCSENFEDDYGKFIDEIARDYNAVAAINAGGFEDEGGSGKGGKPLGIVIKDGKVLNRHTSGVCDIVIGFDQDHKLIVGKMGASEAVNQGIQNCASFGPILVLNGEPAAVKGSSSGLNPRTAIGQRADGAVLMLVIDGRQVNSLGASLADLVDVMMRYGAVNAANLDGGSSSKMYLNGEFINDGVALTGSRRIPTAFIVQ